MNCKEKVMAGYGETFGTKAAVLQVLTLEQPRRIQEGLLWGKLFEDRCFCHAVFHSVDFCSFDISVLQRTFPEKKHLTAVPR